MRLHASSLRRLPTFLAMAWVAWFGAVPAHAQAASGGISGYSEYFILGQEEHVWRKMDRVTKGENSANFPTPNRMNSVASATATADNQIIIYDHWEDGLEVDITNPLQGTTLVLGNLTAGAPAGDGKACNYTRDPRVVCGAADQDKIFAGTALSFESNAGMAGVCAAPYAIPPSLAQVNCSFPVSPDILSITRAGTTATATTVGAVAHGYANGATVRIAGASVAGYNGTFVIATAGPASSTFTYTVPVTLATPAVGTLTVTQPTIRFDGGDRIFSSGGSLSIAHIEDPGTPLIGGGTELLSRELTLNAVSYSIPVGENLFVGPPIGGNNAGFASVKYASLDIVAFDDNTNITVTSPGGTGGVRSMVLHRGQHYSTCVTFGAAVFGSLAGNSSPCLTGSIEGPLPMGFPENRGTYANLALQINGGTKVATTNPLNILIFTGGGGNGAPGSLSYQTRHYATLPDLLHATDYVTTAPGDNPALNAARLLNLFVYNPDPTNTLDVTATDTTGSWTFTIAANSVADYRNFVNLPAPSEVPNDKTVRLTANRPFWGLSSYDSAGSRSSDWGHAWLGVRFLEKDYTLAYSPGTQVTPITTVTRTAGNIATITTGIAHVLGGAAFTVGSLVRVSGVTPASFNGDWVTTAVTATTFSYNNLAGGAVAPTASAGTVIGICDWQDAARPCNSGAAQPNSYNRDPAWVAATQNNTQVRVDLNPDTLALWDFIDTDGDGCPNTGDVTTTSCFNVTTLTTPPLPLGCAVPTANMCMYTVNAPGSAGRNVLRVWDPYDLDNAGTRIVSSRPVAISWGQDVDRAFDSGSDPSPDTGYTVYAGKITVDTVLGIQKSVSPLTVPLAGGVASYTVRMYSSDWGNLNVTEFHDILPVGVTCSPFPGNYVPGSTVITYPNLSTTNGEPTCTIMPGGRHRLDWVPTPTLYGPNQEGFLTYKTNIPANGTPRTLENEAQVVGNIGGSIFKPKDTANVSQTAVTQVKGVTNDGTPEISDIFTYTIAYRNGPSIETNVRITDAIPTFTSYVPASLNLATSVSGITQGAGLATVTMPVAHHYITGASITIAGATPVAFNGAKTITVTSATTFTYTEATAGPVTGTITAQPSVGGFAGSYSAGENAITWTIASWPANAVAIFTFQVQVNQNSATGSIVPNTANYRSDTLESFDSNKVETTLVGPALQITKSCPTQVLHPTELVNFELEVLNTGNGFARNLRILDNVTLGNLTYVPGTMSWSLNAAPFTALTDASDADPAFVTGTTLTFAPIRSITTLAGVGTQANVTTSIAHGFSAGQTVTILGATSDPALWNGSFVILAVPAPTATTFSYTMTGTPVTSPATGTKTADTPLAPGSGIRFRFQATVNAATGGLFASNQATVTATGQAVISSNLCQKAIVGDATVTGHVFLDFNADGIENGLDYPLPNVTVTVLDSTGVTQTEVTDASGNYSAVVPAGVTTLNVDQTDPDILPGVTLSTAPGCPGTPANCNDPQNVTAITAMTVAGTPVGYTPPPVSITKVSSGAGTTVPGQTLTYTVTVTNFTATTQTGITINDAVPTNTTYVNNSATLSTPAIRVTEYYIDNAGVIDGAGDQCTEAGTLDFAGVTCTLTLNNNLQNDYFVIIQGSNDSVADSTPASDYVGLTSAPAGTPGVGAGGLTASLATNRIILTRGANTNAWIGVITVVECMNACDTAGFRLRDVDRIVHTGSAGATDVDGTAWGTVGRVVLFGGANGAGCVTADVTVLDHESCHIRYQPSLTNTITWQRQNADASVTTSTVMSVEFGSAWGVQRVRVGPAAPTAPVTADDGGDGLNLAAEWNTTAITSVVRAQTWVWGTGFTSQPNAGQSAEGAVITLGDGLVQNANETSVAVGTEEPGGTNTVVDFDVYVMTHPQLATDWDFKPDGAACGVGGGGAQTCNVPTNSASTNRLALVYNGTNDAGNNYPVSILAARYSTNTNIQLLRRRSGTDYPAWVQGVNFDAISDTQICGNGNPPAANSFLCTQPSVNANVVVPSVGFTLPANETMVFSFQATVANPLAGGVTQITNTAHFGSAQVIVTPACGTTIPAGSICATVIDTVIRPGVKVEPNNAGFVPFNATTPQTILFSQNVVNRGTTIDSFRVTLDSDLPNWKLELIEPATGAVIATDTNGDGIWDGSVTISTGNLAVNEYKQYTIRATVPAGTAIGIEDSVELTATSAISESKFPGVPASWTRDVGTNEITVLDVTKFGPVVLLPDHSGIVTAGQTIAYTHRLYNNTGRIELFDLYVAGTGATWTRTAHADTNGDGVYTAGVDLAVTQSATLPIGGSQTLFIVVTAPGGGATGSFDVTDLTARARTVPAEVDSVTDTTTILAATSHDLAGGGTRMAAVGETTIFPGSLYNLTTANDRYELSLTASSLFGVDGLLHPTELWVDTGALDGVADTLIARDLNGDGIWDSLCGSGSPPIAPACLATSFNTDGDGTPDVAVAAGATFNYEIRRAIDPAQEIWKEYTTLTATSNSTLENDSVTPQWIIAALSRATIRGMRVDTAGIVEFVTGTQKGTGFFNLYETNERSIEGARTLLNASPVRPPTSDSVMPILYRVNTSPISGKYLLIEETELSGRVFIYGPYAMNNTRLRRGLENVEAQMNHAEVPAGSARMARYNPGRSLRAKARKAYARVATGPEALEAVGRKSPDGLRLDVMGVGEVVVPMSDLRSAGLGSRSANRLELSNAGRRVAFRVANRSGVSSLIFNALAIESDYSDTNPYILSWGSKVFDPTVTLTNTAEPARPGYTRIERNVGYVTVVIPGSDPWQWDSLWGDGSTWPYTEWDPLAGTFDLPRLIERAVGSAPVAIRLAGLTKHQHQVTARINGAEVGRVTFSGIQTGLLTGSVPRSILRKEGNELSLTYSALNEDGSLGLSGNLLLDYLDIKAPMSGVEGGPASLVGIEAYEPDLPNLNRTQYLIVTHPLFKDQADRLADLKEAEGLKTAVVTVGTTYDRFSGGVQDPQAVAALIKHAARESSRLKYVLLFGDDTFDPRNFLGGTHVSFVPSMVGTEGSVRIPNENAYADIDGDGRPDLAIGRLPVSTPEEAVVVVDKIAGQMATLAASGNVHVFVSDDSTESDSNFGAEAAEMSSKLPASSTSVIADMGSGVGVARQTLFGSWGNGVTMTHYFGHGGPEIWTDEALFSVDDTLPEGMSPMVLFAWACQSQWYQNYYGPTINESLFLAPGSGSLASFGPVGISSPAHQRVIYERVYRDLYKEGLSLGEIIRRAKVAALRASPLNQDVVNGFMFFGDPSLRVPRP